MGSLNQDVTSAQWRIWHDRFACSMREIDTMSVDYLRIFGTLTTGDSTLDRQMLNDEVSRYLTIIDMVKFFGEGVRIKVKRNEDCKTVYILIQEHLQNWQKELEYALRTDQAPLEELELMNKFADAVYEHAKWYLDQALVDTPFVRTLRKDTKSVLSLLKAPVVENTDSDIIVHPKRDDMSDTFNRGLAKLHRKY